MKIFIKIFLAGCTTVLFSGCKKYLDVTPDNIATLNSSFSNANETQAYLFGCYSNLQGLADVRANAGFTASGEVLFPINMQDQTTLGGAGGDAGFNLMRGLQNSLNPIHNFWDGYNQGLKLWESIRMCNTFLANVDQPRDVQPFDRARWTAEAKFLKAYYHYWLIRMYGPIPIADVAIPISATSEEVRQKQQTLDSCFNYVIKTLDESIAGLPPAIQNAAAEAGRITSTIALAVKAEVLTTQASPLFNGNPDYASFKNKDGVSLFPSAADPLKWQRAATACKAAIDAAVAAGAKPYELRIQGNIVNMSEQTRQLLTLQGAFVDGWNPEQVWTLNPRFGWQYMAMPRVTAEAAANVFAVYSNFSVPIAQSEIFYTKNGVPVSEDPSWDFAGRHQLRVGDEANKYYIKQDYTTVKGNFDREPRYYSSVAFDGAVWFGSGNTNDNNPNYVNAVNGYASPPDRVRYNATGYWAKKLTHYQSVPGQNTVWQTYPWTFMRLSGLWLLYAECLNEVSGPNAEVYSWIDKVRTRAGLKGVQESWAQYSRNPSKPSTKEGLRQIIHQERRIELAFEGQAGWDLRRWKELQSVLATPFQGWSVFNRTIAGYYQLGTVYQPSFGLRDYLFPIQEYDLMTNPNLVQTPYW
ncbi:RagB/SusD family nutrient uptake outer membrane protein [Terrimonas sp. NA20]|uniref:RagB/SusD family nutrient uptake outer membrane protein n=1 Tax=Terrimonas ginsenosidimutans TaxID=2908004 RepID=A0ABS9KSX2_9BACT|nr:RagB/SusD family nutrient uptake outer membrane protein [Terrimonas ginsenosidimutans]MCG2615426.1 RagB/SusD family nutrient uptake outer membrane protein [Terrimonas ginsenosidimutans]